MDWITATTVTLTLLTGCSSGQVLPPGPLTGAVGGNVTFKTTISSTSPAPLTIAWSFNNGSVPVRVIGSGPGGSTPGSGYEGRVSLNNVTGSLELRQLTLRDSGQYSVTLITNTAATQTGRTTLNVYEPVSSVTVRANATDLVEFNDTVALTCSALGLSLSYRWHNGSSDITPSERVHLSGDNKILTISSVLRSDRGPLFCTVYNVVSNGTSPSVFLNISYGPEKVVMQGPSEIEVGHTVVLTCSASSVPPVTFTWTLNGTETAVITEKYTVENASFRDSGTYTCVAKNSVTGSNISSAPHVLTVKVSAGPNSESQLGAILGGTFGAVGCVAVAGGAFAYIKKRKRRDSPSNQDHQATVYENTIDLSPVVYGNLPTGSTGLPCAVDSENRHAYEELRFKDTATYSSLNRI